MKTISPLICVANLRRAFLMLLLPTTFGCSSRDEGSGEATAVQRGYAASIRGEYDEAISEYSEAIRLNPSADGYYYMRGGVYAAKKDYANALTDYNEAIRLSPRSAEYYSSRGSVYWAMKDHAKAIADFSEAVQHNPRFDQYYICRGRAYWNMREYANALGDYDEVIRRNPRRSDYYSERGSIFLEMKQYATAIADFNETIRLDPENGGAHTSLAWILATCPKDELRDGKRAVELATRACELSDWKNPNDLENLAAAYAELGDFAKATKWQLRAIELGAAGVPGKEDARQLLRMYEAHKAYRDN